MDFTILNVVVVMISPDLFSLVFFLNNQLIQAALSDWVSSGPMEKGKVPGVADWRKRPDNWPMAVLDLKFKY